MDNCKRHFAFWRPTHLPEESERNPEPRDASWVAGDETRGRLGEGCRPRYWLRLSRSRCCSTPSWAWQLPVRRGVSWSATKSQAPPERRLSQRCGAKPSSSSAFHAPMKELGNGQNGY